MTKLILHAKIQDDKIHYDENDYRFHVDKFKSKNESNNIEITFEAVDTPQFYQYKFYWGYLLPDIAYSSGERDIHMVHVGLKRDFLYIECDNVDVIPKRYLKRGIFSMSFSDIAELPGNVPYSLIRGSILVHKNEVLSGFIPSVSKETFHYDEMKNYILDCENRLFVDLAGQMGSEKRDPHLAIDMRKKAFENVDVKGDEIK